MHTHIKTGLLLTSLAALALGVPTGSAHAADDFGFAGLSQSCYAQAAVTMTPYDESVQEDLVHMTHERVYHKDGATGTILLFGSIQPWLQQYGDAVSFKMTYRDPDGREAGAQVRAELRFVGPGGIHILGRLDSNQRARATSEVQTMSVPLDWQLFDRTDGYYMVRVYITRTTTALSPAAFGYSFCSLIG